MTATMRRAPLRPVLDVLGSPHVPRLLSGSLIGRLPTGMAPLAILLLVRANEGDYRWAGILTGVYAASAACAGPALGRIIDRTRQTPVLLGSGLLSALGFWVLAAFDPVDYAVVALGAAALAGAATPQLEPCLRVLWEHVLASDRTVRAAFSLDAATQELIFVCGPLVVLAVTIGGGPPAGLVAAGTLGMAGTVWFATARPARDWRSSAPARHWAGPLRSAHLIRLFAALSCVGGTIGAFTVGITSYAEAAAAPTAASWLIAANAGGALVFGVLYTVFPAARAEDLRFRLLMGALALGYVPLLFVPGIGLMAPLAFLSGCALPASLASAFSLVSRLAPKGTITEAHAWMITSFGVGNAAGSALAGTMADLVSVRAALGCAVAAACVAFLLVLPRMRA